MRGPAGMSGKKEDDEAEQQKAAEEVEGETTENEKRAIWSKI